MNRSPQEHIRGHACPGQGPRSGENSSSALLSVCPVVFALLLWFCAAPQPAQATPPPQGPPPAQVTLSQVSRPTPTPAPQVTGTPAAPAAPPAPVGNGDPIGATILRLIKGVMNEIKATLDPLKWARQVFLQLIASLAAAAFAGLFKPIIDWANAVNFLTSTPASLTYGNGVVTQLSGGMQGVANAALGLIALWGGINIMVKEHIRAPYHEIMEFFPRLLLGAILANTSLQWSRLVIDAVNGLSAFVGLSQLPGYDATAHFQQVLQQVLQETGNPATAPGLPAPLPGIALSGDPLGQVLQLVLVDGIALVCFGIVALLLIFQMLMRLALIDVLLVVAPLGLVCWILPQTQRWAQLWAQLFFSLVIVQFLQVITLAVGSRFLALGLTGTEGISQGVLEVLLGIAVLWSAFKVPSFLQHVGGPGLGYIGSIGSPLHLPTLTLSNTSSTTSSNTTTGTSSSARVNAGGGATGSGSLGRAGKAGSTRESSDTTSSSGTRSSRSATWRYESR